MIYAATMNFLITDSYAAKNTARQGGAFSIDSGSERQLSIQIERNEFEMNSALSYGGVFYIQPSFATSPENRVVLNGNITNNKFRNNYADLNRGGILWVDNSIISRLTISDSVIDVDNNNCFSLVNTYSIVTEQLIILSNLSFTIQSSTSSDHYGVLIYLVSRSEDFLRTIIFFAIFYFMAKVLKASFWILLIN